MPSLLPEVVRISAGGSALILFAILIRFLFKKMPGIFMYCIWIIIFINLVSTVSFKIPYAKELYNFNEILFEIENNVSKIEIPDPNIDTTFAKNLKNVNAEIYILEILWISIGTFILLINLYKFISLKNILKLSKNITDNIYVCENISTPFVIGWFSPKIYIPSNIDEDEKCYVILHEKMHIKHIDNFIKTAAFAVLAIHWFNPFVWIAYSMFSEDIERFCDESVLKSLGSKIKKKYSLTLLKLSSESSLFDSIVLKFGANKTKRRVSNVLMYKKPNALIISISVTSVIAVGCLAFISPYQSNGEELNNSISNDFKILEYEIEFNTDFSSDTYLFSVSLPDETASYCQLEYYDDRCPICLIKFTKGSNTANIGMFSFFGEDEYDAMDPAQMPVPIEVMRVDGIVIAFTGIQDSVFEIGTEEAEIVKNYDSVISEVLKSVDFIKI